MRVLTALFVADGICKMNFRICKKEIFVDVVILCINREMTHLCNNKRVIYDILHEGKKRLLACGLKCHKAIQLKESSITL